MELPVLRELIERAFLPCFEEKELEAYRPAGLGVPFLLSAGEKKLAVRILLEVEAGTVQPFDVDRERLEEAGVQGLRSITWNVPQWRMLEDVVEWFGEGKDDALPIEELLLNMSECESCQLRLGCTQVVPFEVLSEPVKVLFVGRDPGADEDEQGRPFVGVAGKILRGLVSKFGFDVEGCAISNITKCRPANNKFPGDVVAKICSGIWLTNEVRTLKPEVLVAIGGDAYRILTGDEAGISSVRGIWRNTLAPFGKKPVMPIFHPSYYLRAEAEKKKEIAKQISEDLLKVKERIKEI